MQTLNLISCSKLLTNLEWMQNWRARLRWKTPFDLIFKIYTTWTFCKRWQIFLNRMSITWITKTISSGLSITDSTGNSAFQMVHSVSIRTSWGSTLNAWHNFLIVKLSRPCYASNPNPVVHICINRPYLVSRSLFLFHFLVLKHDNRSFRTLLEELSSWILIFEICFADTFGWFNVLRQKKKYVCFLISEI